MKSWRPYRVGLKLTEETTAKHESGAKAGYETWFGRRKSLPPCAGKKVLLDALCGALI